MINRVNVIPIFKIFFLLYLRRIIIIIIYKNCICTFCFLLSVDVGKIKRETLLSHCIVV